MWSYMDVLSMSSDCCFAVESVSDVKIAASLSVLLVNMLQWDPVVKQVTATTRIVSESLFQLPSHTCIH